jgi:CheY-like chemotaxis protein
MDCQMPELNGYEATARIRALESPRRLTPIIAMTAGARHEDRQRCLAEGMDSYLAKPVSKDALLALVARSVKSGRTMNLPVPPDDGDEDDGVVIDERTFDELRLLGEAVERDFVGELVDAFIEATGPLLISLRTAIEIGDGPTVSGIAHDIRGSSVQLGGQHLAFLCSRLEDKAKAGALIGGGLALQQIESGYHDLCDALSRKISSSHPQPVGGIGV